jgi:hypothetical protein
LALATPEDIEKARSYLNTRSVQLGLAFGAASFPEDLDFKAIAKDFKITERRARQLFKQWKAAAASTPAAAPEEPEPEPQAEPYEQHGPNELLRTLVAAEHLWQVSAPLFVAGLVTDAQARIRRAAPILSSWRGSLLLSFARHASRRGWQLTQLS